MAEEKPKCDIDDLMCQFQALNLLEGMEKLVGTETFQEKYPDFKQLGNVVKERMSEQRITIKEALEKCGMDTSEFMQEEGMSGPETSVEEK